MRSRSGLSRVSGKKAENIKSVHDLLCFGHFKGFQKPYFFDNFGNIFGRVFGASLLPAIWGGFWAMLGQFVAIWGPPWVFQGGSACSLFCWFLASGPQVVPKRPPGGAQGCPEPLQVPIFYDFWSLLGWILM